MKKIFITIALALTLFATAPVSQASAMTLQQQRNQTFQALGDIMSELRTELSETLTQFRESTNPAERNMLRQKIRSQRARMRFTVTTRRMARNFYNAEQLDVLIVRYDLPVSRS